MITGIRIPSIPLWKMQEAWVAELEAQINSEALLSYVFRKKERLGKLKSFLRTKTWLAYEKGQKELEKQYSLCDTCMGRGIYTIADTRTKVSCCAYCFCKRGAEMKDIIERYDVKKD